MVSPGTTERIDPKLAPIRERMAEFWGFGPRSRVGLGEIAEQLRQAVLSPRDLGALWASIPRTGGMVGRRCDVLRDLVAGLEKEVR